MADNLPKYSPGDVVYTISDKRTPRRVARVVRGTGRDDTFLGFFYALDGSEDRVCHEEGLTTMEEMVASRLMEPAVVAIDPGQMFYDESLREWRVQDIDGSWKTLSLAHQP